MKTEILDRFLSYVKIYTTSDRHQDRIPSTERQWDLIRLLEQELKDIGINDIEVTENGYIIARLAASEGVTAPTIGFMAHVDTAEDAPGEHVKPQVWEHYSGDVLEIGNGIKLDPKEYPVLTKCKGKTIITSDGSTLLGADDKAGVAEIMTAVEYYVKNPDKKHGPVEIIFTPDEETGKGMDKFPVEKLDSICCYTMDGDEEGYIESECFTAYKADVSFSGRQIHPGSARGIMINPISMATKFLALLPGAESPEATDGRFGFYYPLSLKADFNGGHLELYIRDHSSVVAEKRLETLKSMAKAVEAIYPGGVVAVKTSKQYLNMRDYIDKDKRILDLLKRAIQANGIEPREKLIRGGTDGARLSEMGIPTPNIFTGGQNFHSLQEWCCLESMEMAAKTIISLIDLWSRQT